jgi:23S rRNA (uracil1939-C5)-methyltransferase
MENLKECKLKGLCGGCLHQGVPYEEQAKLKDEQMYQLFEKYNVASSSYQGLVPAITPYRYRNKMEYTFGDQEIGGPLELGMHQKGRFMSIVTCDECQLVPEDFNRVLSATLEFCRGNGYSFYHKKTHQGLLRNLVIRHGVRTNELLVDIITSSEEGFDEEGYLKTLQALELDNTLVGVLHTLNDSLADAVIDESTKILYGRDYYYEEILGLRFQVKTFAFFQTNIDAVERLYSDALSLLPDINEKIVYDLYCGTGTITQLMASKAKRAYGVEIVEDSVEAAKFNAKLNGIENCEFLCGDVKNKLDELTETPDMIVVDPPRAGMHDKVVHMLCRYGIPEILYISCNPKTLCMNLELFKMNGYEPKYMKAYDNFPMTKHVETVCLLSNRKPDTKVKIDVDLEDYYRIKDSKKNQD